MPWKTMSTLELRREFVQQAEAGAISFAELCARYEISRKTGYKGIVAIGFVIAAGQLAIFWRKPIKEEPAA